MILHSGGGGLDPGGFEAGAADRVLAKSVQQLALRTLFAAQRLLLSWRRAAAGQKRYIKTEL
jgi:hypothetical protein